MKSILMVLVLASGLFASKAQALTYNWLLVESSSRPDVTVICRAQTATTVTVVDSYGKVSVLPKRTSVISNGLKYETIRSCQNILFLARVVLVTTYNIYEPYSNL